MSYAKFMPRIAHGRAHVNVILLVAIIVLAASFASAAPSTISASGITSPYGSLWLPGSLGGHLWVADHALGFCRLDATAPGSTVPLAISIAA